MSDATIRQTPEPDQRKPVMRRALRLLLLVVTAVQMAFIALLTALVIRGVSHVGDGREYVAVIVAVILLEIPFTIPAFILALRDRALGTAACLTGFATFAYVMFWIQLYAEVTTRGA